MIAPRAADDAEGAAAIAAAILPLAVPAPVVRPLKAHRTTTPASTMRLRALRRHHASAAGDRKAVVDPRAAADRAKAKPVVGATKDAPPDDDLPAIVPQVINRPAIAQAAIGPPVATITNRPAMSMSAANRR